MPAAPPTASGLSRVEAARRLEEGLGNAAPASGETTWGIVRRNTVTFFNVILFGLVAALVVIGELRDGLFVGAVTGANVFIATGQELIALRRLRTLRALTAPTADVIRDGESETVPAEQVVQGDVILLRRGDQVVADGVILSGSVEVDESLLTGESQTVRHGSGDELRSGVYCVAGECRYEAVRVGADAYAHRLSEQSQALVGRATPLMARFDRLLRVILIGTGALAAVLFIQFNVQDRGFAESLRATTATVSTIVPVGLLLGITVVAAAGAVRVSRAGAIVQDIYAVEALNYVDVIAFDKTGTLTSNRLVFDRAVWAEGQEATEWLGAFAIETRLDGPVNAALYEALADASNGATAGERVAFSSARRWSALELERGGARRVFVLGAPETVVAGSVADRDELMGAYAELARQGFRGLALAEASALPDPDRPLAGLRSLALLAFRDELRPEVAEAFALMEELQITPKVISGDHPETVVGILAQLGITGVQGVSGETLEGCPEAEFAAVVEQTTVFGRVAPSLKARIVSELKADGHFVAMVGDGANDVPALQQADVAVAMASGTAMARGVAGIVLLRDSFAALIRGTREATFVLGNSGRLAKLFVAKSVYTYVLILATNLLGLEFPFLPRQGSVMSTLSLGIPALFIALSTPPANSTQDLTTKIVRFALPAGVALGVSAMAVQFIAEGLLGRDVEESRTLVSLTITIVALAFFVQVFGLEEGVGWFPWRALLATGGALLLLMVLVAVVRTEGTRAFFAFSPVSPIGWTAVGIASVAALLGQHWLTRNWRRVVDLLIARPSASAQQRGRGV